MHRLPFDGRQHRKLRQEVSPQRKHSSILERKVTEHTFPSLQIPLLRHVKELFGDTSLDPYGHWNFSPEWWGLQADGWGRNAGTVIFSEHSQYNGKVTVTAHPTSTNPREEWRVLRFNDQTRQSVSRVDTHAGHAAIPHSLAFEYLKTVASIIASIVGIHNYSLNTFLAIGLGGGSLPHFITHFFPETHVTALEIDEVVVSAAVKAMGLPADRANLHIITANAYDYIVSAIQDNNDNPNNERVATWDGIFLDAFDGVDEIPPQLCSVDFVSSLGKRLHPSRGFLIINVHTRQDAEVLIDILKEGIPDCQCCYTVKAEKQCNQAVVLARGVNFESVQEARYVLASAAEQSHHGYPFLGLGRKAVHDLRLY